jgi:4-amino-4-deoxy-L-arabinose transferase-like glycosyltransferase
MGDFYTKGEPREASVALSMIEKNNWILPQAYADEIAYKPPLTHWLMAVFSLPKGEVTPFTSRLPSALAFLGIIVVSFFLFGRKLKFTETYLACIILLTSFELHRAAMTARVDMLLTFFILTGLLCLYKWEVREKVTGLPLIIPILLGLAALTKGPVGIILPLLVFGVYLLILRYNFRKIAGKLALVAVCALILPGIWYFFAYKSGGQEFLDLVWAENFGRFLRSSELNISYMLGHNEPILHYVLTLLGGFIPWTIFFFISLFAIKYSFKIPGFKTIRDKILSMEKVKIFSLVAAVVIILFYCIPSSKRSVYLMPAYPFIALFIAGFVLHIAEHRPSVNKIFSIFISIIGIVVTLICLATVVTHFVDPVDLTARFTDRPKTLNDVAVIRDSLNQPKILYILPICALIMALYILFYQLRKKKNNVKLLYATVGVYFTIFLVADGIFLPAYKSGISLKPFAEKLKIEHDLSIHPVYVMNNLLEYSNMYSMNFYLGNNFLNFENEKPEYGYFLTGKDSFQKVLAKYGNQYSFRLLNETVNRTRDGEKILQFYYFNKAGLIKKLQFEDLGGF